MMKMLIQLDEQRVIGDGQYDLADMWRIIDGKFAESCTKEIQPDGARLYSGNPKKDYYTEIMLAAMILSKQEWFADYCCKWVWFDNDDDEELPFQDIDVLARERHENPLFSR